MVRDVKPPPSSFLSASSVTCRIVCREIYAKASIGTPVFDWGIAIASGSEQ